MGKRGRTLQDLAASDDAADQLALSLSDKCFYLASQFGKSGDGYAPLGFFELCPDDLDNNLQQHVLWRLCTKFMGPWVKRGVAKAMVDPDAKFDAETRIRYAAALEHSGCKEARVQARDYLLVLGMFALHRRGVSISGSEPKTSNLQDSDRYAAHRALEYGIGGISVSAVEKTWKNREQNLAAVFAGVGGDGQDEWTEVCRTFLRN